MSVYEDHEGSCCSFDGDEYDEVVLPFALNEESTTTVEEMRPLHSPQPKLRECSVKIGTEATSVVASPESFPSLQSTLSQPPPLMSSVLTTESSLDSSMTSEQWGGGETTTFLSSSRHLDAAASLMASMAGNGLQMTMTTEEPLSSTLPQQQQPLSNNTPPESHYSRLGFSRLLQNAGDASEDIGATSLPVLHEEEDATDSFHSAREEPSFPSNISSTTSQIMTTADWVPVDNPRTSCSSSSRGCYRPPILAPEAQQRQQKPQDREGVYARQLDPTSFEVSIDVAPGLSVVDIMEVLGNPSYLVLWCESVRSLVIINSSEGVCAATNPPGTEQQQKRKGGQVRAVHEGEWIEASTTDLITPASSSSCLYSTSKAMWNIVGFPSHYGNVSMFVERPNGRVGLSIGPFAGDVTVSHSIRVEQQQAANGLTSPRIVDRVTLSREVSNADRLCGFLDCLESCFLPTLKGYMDQVVASMIRLRVLLETGEGGSQQEGFELIHTRQQQVVY